MLKNKIIPLYCLLLAFSIITKAQTTVKRNWLFNAHQQAYPKGNALPALTSWQEQQQAESIKAIATLPDSLKQKLIRNAENANNYKWPSLPASLYLDYKLTGTRVNYENLQGERRKMLSQLVIGELVDNKGKYIPQIVNGLWLVLEESTWVAPAHIVVQKEGADLANIENPYIDLNASRTALTVASIYSVLAPKFATYSKVVNSRILYELNRRIFDPYLKYDYFWWMGFKGNSVNNWNTYVNANSLQAALLVLKPGSKLDSLTSKLLRSTDNFINQYPEDGGCDEGPSYWDMAGGRLIRLMLILNQSSGGKLDWSDKELLHRIGAYTYKMQIAGNYNVNFADANAIYTQNPESVYEYGLMFKDKTLKDYASFLFKERKNQIPTDDVSDFLASADIYNDLKSLPSNAPYPQYSVLPDLQVFNARLKAGDTKGLFFAAKGGNNAESHNHNDIGNFIVYASGKPALIDAGVGTYTAKTFSSKRYELWNVQSQWHNCPTINGVNQQDGKAFAASDFKYSNSNSMASVSMDIAKAYPAAAEVKKWNRSIVLNRAKNEINLVDDFTLNAYKAPTELNFLTPYKAELSKGKLILKEAGISISFDASNFEVNIDEKPMDDARIIKIWGEKLYRIRLISKNKNTIGTYKIQIQEN
ncbi:heparinase II/III domain-containing protein [Pedobacter nototheniae]|uniref:heparinase II/III domain-containing protein n=1 Tax=Pedobacter nototheniae TaxID=2488994 RepID=UPI00103D9592|nr:heparinase II/III family protein [Pedobacter nototheniae]